MPDNPDLRHDIDALFAHLTENLARDPDQEMEWHFILRSPDLAKLTRLGEELSEEFDHIHLQEEVETVDEDGRVSKGPPLLAAVAFGSLSPDDVKALAARFKSLAQTEGLTYEGVDTYEALDMDELFGWLELEDAIFRLRHFTDTGIEEGSDVPFLFAIEATERLTLESVAAALEAEGFEDLEIIEEEDDEDEPGLGLLVRFDGRNDEALLRETYTRIERVVTPSGAEFLGVQFIDAAEEEDLLDDEDADEDDET